MGRIDRSKGQDATMERRHIQQMLKNIDEYEMIKTKKHPQYKLVQELFDAKGIIKQNFHTFYNRYLLNNRNKEALIPKKAGRKYKDILDYKPEVIGTVKALREKGYNRYDIAEVIKEKDIDNISPSVVYQLTKRLGINRLNIRIKEEKRKIIKMHAGELGHIDIHYVTKGTVKETKNKKLYIIGLIDDYSRVCWLEVIDSIKAIDVMFAGMDLILALKKRYDIAFKEILSDNGSEFSSKTNPQHPFEKMLKFYDIKHRYTKPYRPQTNGKIERFWKTLEDELLDGETFDTLDEFKDYVLGYVLYYNEHRMHQGIQNKKPAQMLASFDEKIKEQKVC